MQRIHIDTDSARRHSPKPSAKPSAKAPPTPPPINNISLSLSLGRRCFWEIQRPRAVRANRPLLSLLTREKGTRLQRWHTLLYMYMYPHHYMCTTTIVLSEHAPRRALDACRNDTDSGAGYACARAALRCSFFLSLSSALARLLALSPHGRLAETGRV